MNAWMLCLGLGAAAAEPEEPEVPAPATDTAEAEAPPPPPPPPAQVVRKAPDASDAPGDAPLGIETPCEWLMRHRNHGTTLPRLIELAQLHRELFTAKDTRCAREAGLHKRVLQAIRRPTDAELAERKGESAEDRFDVQFVGVVLGPAKLSGEAWDTPDPTAFTGEDLAAMSALAPPGAVRVVDQEGMTALLQRAEGRLTDATSAPEIFGHVEYRGPSVPMHWLGGRLLLRPSDDVARDSLYSSFPSTPAFRGIRVRESDLLVVSLIDQDPTGDHDAAQVFELRRSDLDALAMKGGTAGLLVADRTANEVLLLMLSVFPSEQTAAASKGTFYKP